MSLPDVYRDTFKRFDDAGGQWVATWNWAAFVFGVFWYLYRGMWVKALIYLVVGGFLAAVTGGFLSPLIWIAIGLLGNYDLYLLERQGTQMWRPEPSGLPGMDQPFSSPRPGPVGPSVSASDRLYALDLARKQGALSESEYDLKRPGLLLDVERQRKVDALVGMHRAGLLSDHDLELKKGAVLAGEMD